MTIDTAAHTFRLPDLQQVLDLALNFFNETPVHPLPPPAFKGTGVYALYYTGDFEPYAPIAARNRVSYTLPIYVGKAVGAGWRTARTTGGVNSELANRLREHARSIESTNLRVSDFYCRFMILGGDEANLITLVEAGLTRKYRPLWNSIVDGFGNHDPGKGRYNQAISEWDALHSGRSWVAKLTGGRPAREAIAVKIRQHLELLDALPPDIQREADSQEPLAPLE